MNYSELKFGEIFTIDDARIAQDIKGWVEYVKLQEPFFHDVARMPLSNSAVLINGVAVWLILSNCNCKVVKTNTYMKNFRQLEISALREYRYFHF